jgi:hypothetical protein
MTLSDILATIGVSLLLIAFVLSSRRVLSVENRTYAILNIAGASLCGYSAYLISFYPFVVLETVWALVALASLIKIVSRGTPRVI